MTDEEFNRKMERVVNKTTPKRKSKKKKGPKTNAYQLWRQLTDEQLRKLGYIK